MEARCLCCSLVSCWFVTTFLSFTEELSRARTRGSMGTTEHRPCTMHWQLLRARASDMHSSTPPTSPRSPPHVPSTWLGHGPWSPAWPDHSKAFSGQQQLNLCTCRTLENIPIQLSDVLKNSPITHFVTTSFSSKKAINIGNDLAMKPAKIVLG